MVPVGCQEAPSGLPMGTPIPHPPTLPGGPTWYPDGPPSTATEGHWRVFHEGTQSIQVRRSLLPPFIALGDHPHFYQCTHFRLPTEVTRLFPLATQSFPLATRRPGDAKADFTALPEFCREFLAIVPLSCYYPPLVQMVT